MRGESRAEAVAVAIMSYPSCKAESRGASSRAVISRSPDVMYQLSTRPSCYQEKQAQLGPFYD